MKKNILVTIIIILAAILVGGGVYWYLTKPLYGENDKLTTEILSAHEWSVEANGMYDYIVLKSDGNFTVYVYPDKTDVGSWTFDSSILTLDFASAVDNRTYNDSKFDKKGSED